MLPYKQPEKSQQKSHVQCHGQQSKPSMNYNISSLNVIDHEKKSNSSINNDLQPQKNQTLVIQDQIHNNILNNHVFNVSSSAPFIEPYANNRNEAFTIVSQSMKIKAQPRFINSSESANFITNIVDTPQKRDHSHRLKPMPSIELAQNLLMLCQNTQNYYDNKNHILTLNDVNSFETAVRDKFNRSLKSFQRQLKICGFRMKKYRFIEYPSLLNSNNIAGYNIISPNSRSAQIRVYKWKGKKQLLIQQQLGCIQKLLKSRRHELQQIKKSVSLCKQQLDLGIQNLIFSLIIGINDPESSITQKQIMNKEARHSRLQQSSNGIVSNIRQNVNSAQMKLRKIIGKISMCFSHELQLYKLLIYKETVGDKKMQQREQHHEEELRNKNNSIKNQDYNNEIDQQIQDQDQDQDQEQHSGSGSQKNENSQSNVSIQVDNVERKQRQMEK